jgi:long-chain acyl-CoA synthetase
MALMKNEADVLRGDTVATMFWRHVQAREDAVAMREKDYGIWQSITWREFGERAKYIGLGLTSLGLEPGDRVCVLSQNNAQWLYTDMGVLGAAGVCSGIYPTDSATQVAFLVNHCEARFIFVEDEEQLDKVLERRAEMPSLMRTIVFDMQGLRDLEDDQVMSLDALLTLGAAYERDNPGEWEKRIRLSKPEDLAILVYTSGTTGPPKGAMISHHSLVYHAENSIDLLPSNEMDERLSFLPLCHIAERGAAYLAIHAGLVTNFAENVDTVPENLREVQPHNMIAVPRVWEKFYSAITIAIADATPIQQLAYKWAIGTGYRIAELKLNGRPVPASLRLQGWLGYHLALKNVRRMIGIDRCRWVATGAAPISPDLIKWYLALGVPMIEAYGQTESAGIATLMPADAIRLGSIGRAVPHAKVAVSPEGEILIRGDIVFMGYYREPEKTAETIRDGWLHTGDVGRIDSEGYVTISDRMKDIIITAGGKNITPSEIENQLKFSPYISDAVVVGDGRKYLTCLVMLDHENVAKFAQDNGVPFSNFASLTKAQEVVDLINQEVEAVNSQFARVETIKYFRLIDRELDPEDEELTPTMKLKRAFVNKKYGDLIESMYKAS